MSFSHLRRHAPRAKGEKIPLVLVVDENEVVANKVRFDLRTGTGADRFTGFFPAPGRVVLAWKQQRIEAIHPGGTVVRIDHPLLIDPKLQGPRWFTVVGPWLVAAEDKNAPWLVFDLRTGACRGPLRGQARQPFSLYPMFAPILSTVDDGTLWLGELARVVQFDLESCSVRQIVEVPEGHVMTTFTVLGDHVIGNLRPTEAHRAHRATEDRLVALRFDGTIAWSAARRTMSVATVGSVVVASEHEAMRLVVLDERGVVQQELAFVDPNTKRPFAMIVPLPGGRSFLTLGANSEWDHWGHA